MSKTFRSETLALGPLRGLNDGEDIEDVEDWRNKILAGKRNPPHGGSEEDYEKWKKSKQD